MKKALLALSFLFLPLYLITAQEQQIDAEFQGVHHMKDPSELDRMDEIARGFSPSQLPIGPIRNIAEFNRMEGVLIAYDNGFGIPLALIAEMSQDCKVWTIVTSVGIQSSVSSMYMGNGVNMANCEFLVKPVNSYWTRDYGPWFILDGNFDVSVVDFPYNRPRPSDDAIPIHVATAMNLNVYNMNLIHTGGNYMTDGMGVSASTDLVAAENPGLSVAQINQLASDYLGIQNYYLNDDPLGLYIEHIDCWGKFLDVDKILLGEVPMSDPRYSDYEAVASFYGAHLSSYGTPYEIHRVYSPNGQPYTNSLILNNKVLVPVVSGTGSNWNDTAIARYEQAMPGYEVIPIAQYSAAAWQTSDALHCRAIGLADRDLLDIFHIPLLGTIPPQGIYEIVARIVAASDSGLLLDSVYCAYSINGAGYVKGLMVPDTANTFKFALTGLSVGTEVDYYIHASDSTGRSEFHPFIGVSDPHHFMVQNVVGELGQETDLKTRLRILPNPAEIMTFINFSTWREGEVDIRVYSLDGKLVKNYSAKHISSGKHQWKLDLSSWSPGMYVVHLSSVHGAFSSKFIVK